jgi:hypothetical protein
MHWIFWAILACLVFLATYDPRRGKLQKFFTPEMIVNDDPGASQSNGNTSQYDQ